VEPSIPACDKGKRKIVDRMEEEQRCKFRVDPLVEQASMAIQHKRQQREKRITRRQRDKKRMEETKKELHELREKLQKEQELRQQKKEAKHQ